VLTPFSPPAIETLATRMRSNAQCRAAVLDRYTALSRRLLASHGDLETLDRCEACRGDAAALARLRALITGEPVLWEDWRRAPRERVTA
jgi:hypothetical protein